MNRPPLMPNFNTCATLLMTTRKLALSTQSSSNLWAFHYRLWVVALSVINFARCAAQSHSWIFGHKNIYFSLFHYCLISKQYNYYILIKTTCLEKDRVLCSYIDLNWCKGTSHSCVLWLHWNYSRSNLIYDVSEQVVLNHFLVLTSMS